VVVALCAGYSPRAAIALENVAATAVGIACTEGILRLDEPVSEVFPDEMPPEVSENLKKMTVRDVLCMGTGMKPCKTG
jgi:CubicO group peptidase (beta-lactamase class C family)